MHEKLVDFSKLTQLTSLYLDSCALWTSDLENLRGLENNESLTIGLTDNRLIDPNILLEFPSECKIYLKGNINISEDFKAKLTEHFGKNVSF